MTVSPTLMPTLNAAQPTYLWAVGLKGEAISEGTLVGDRFSIVSPHVWRDEHAHTVLERDGALPARAMPYLKLYAHRLHVPQPYGIYTPNPEESGSLNGSTNDSTNDSTNSSTNDSTVLLLDNAPIDAEGHVLPSLEMAWSQASPVRQLYWLWQQGELWEPLATEHVAASLLYPDNLRVREWRLQLCELIADTHSEKAEPASASGASFEALGDLWMTWAETAHLEIQATIRAIAQALQAPDASWQAIAPQLNEALLAQAARLPLRIDIAGATHAGKKHAHNEDAAFPLTLGRADIGVEVSQSSPEGLLHPRLAIVCDGIGGHSGGEVASQLVVRALKLQISALFADIFEMPQSELTSPSIVAKQLEAAVRVVNNLIAIQNDGQGRQSRQRMGTTLTMAVQFPQLVHTPNGKVNGHELYVVQVGDSRAYWLTPNHCHCLTLDDDVKTREVLAGRSLPHEAARRSDAIALTQALGTRQGEQLRIRVQRFLLEEDGVLLLCSDGLSDNHLVERYGQSITTTVLNENSPLEDAITSWINLANQHNGHDNISLVMMRCRVSKEEPNGFAPSPSAIPQPQEPDLQEPDLREPEQSELDPQELEQSEPEGNVPTFGDLPADFLQVHPIDQASSSSQSSSQSASRSKTKRSKKGTPSTQAPSNPSSQPPDSRGADATPLSLSSEMESPYAEFAKAEAVSQGRKSNYSQPQSPDTSNASDDWSSYLMGYRPNRPSSASASSVTPTTEEDLQDWNWMAIALGLVVVIFAIGSVSTVAWRFLAPNHFNRTLDKLVETYEDVFLPEELVPESESQVPSEIEIEAGDSVFEESAEESPDGTAVDSAE
ncbi:MAG: protein phosphatase 2C domain-containing protein [Elainellaceae cyanobacterium]